MKVEIIYFSGTGNTKFFIQKLEYEMKKNDFEVDTHSIEDRFNFSNETYDLLVLACPKYIEYAPWFFIDFIRYKLPRTYKETPAMIIYTGATPGITNSGEIGEILKGKKYYVIMNKTIKMPNNYVVYGNFKKTSAEEAAKQKEEAAQTAKEIVFDFLRGNLERTSFKGKGEWLISKFSKLYTSNDIYKSKNFSVDEDRCIQCGTCSRTCPASSIEMRNNKPEFLTRCYMCMRCINICPKNAIIYKNTKYAQVTDNIELVEE